MPSVLTELASVQAFSDQLQTNAGLVILKFGAEWCGPCKRIDPLVQAYYDRIVVDPFYSSRVTCGLIDVDANFEVYGFLKSKRRVRAIPAMLCWYKGNATYIPDEMIEGSDESQLHGFFERILTAVKKM
jgi:thiol-disulfide isomerase/thioredoxin